MDLDILLCRLYKFGTYNEFKSVLRTDVIGGESLDISVLILASDRVVPSFC